MGICPFCVPNRQESGRTAYVPAHKYIHELP
jgi:hypothetical protein